MELSSHEKTFKKEISFSGKGLQTGSPAEVVLRPAPEHSGIVFVRTDLKNKPSFRLGENLPMTSFERRSAVGKKGAEVETVEHLLAALWALGVDNAVIEVKGREIPALDGSAAEFLKVLAGAGIKELSGPKQYIKVTEPVAVEEKDSALTLLPFDGFKVSYKIDYDCPSIEKETFSADLSAGVFEKEIAPARTFCLKKEVGLLMGLGFGKGANYENTLVMDTDGPVKTTLRFKNEPVRHKILDIVGDMYLLGMPLICEVKAEKSGHKLNREMIRKVYERYCL